VKTFEYRGFDPSGRSASGLIEALDPKEAREKLAARGLLAERVQPVGQQPSTTRWVGRSAPRFNAATRATVYHELGALIHSGLPVTQALHVLVETPELGRIRPALARLGDLIKEGGSLSAALAAVGESVSPFELAVLEAGQRSGDLEAALRHLASFLEEQQKIRDKVQTALIYPLMVVLMAVLVATLVFTIMLPSLARMLTEVRVDLPLITRLLMGAGRVFNAGAAPVAAALALAALYLRRRWKTQPEFRIRFNRRLFQIPWWGACYTSLVNNRFARTLALLTQGGVPVVEGLELAGRATGSAWVARLVSHEADSVRHGQSMAGMLRRVPPLAHSLPGWIQAGETSGNLVPLLEAAAARYEQQWNRQVSRGMNLLEPALVILIGLFVLLVALAILLPVLSLNKGLG
jgi:general secretion pathway protein F